MPIDIRSPSLTALKTTELLHSSKVESAAAPLPSSHGGPPPALHPSESALDAVLQIDTSHRVPDSVQPWRRQSPTRSVGTAFAVSGRLVVTSAMHALYATHVTLRRRGHDEPFVASVLAASHDADIAVLAVNDAAFWQGLRPLQLGPVPPLQDRVAALAFRADADNVAVATGALSRVKMDDLDASVGARLVVAVDLRQSRDDRGAPVVDARDCVVGMLTAPRARLVAADTLRRFLNELATTGAFSPVPHAGFEWQPTVNRSLRRALRMPPGQGGVYVRAVPPGAPSAAVLRTGDVITALDGVSVSSKGTVRFRGREKVSLTYVTAHKLSGERLTAEILRNGQKLSVAYDLVGHDVTTLVPLRRFDSRPDYVTVGGLVFAMLSEQYLLDAWGKDWPHAAPLRLRELVEDGVSDSEVRRVVLLTQMLTSRMTVMYEYAMPGPCRLVRVNGKIVPDLEGFVKMVNECTDEFLVFDLEERVVVLDRKEAMEQSPKILAEHGAMHAARIGEVAGEISDVACGKCNDDAVDADTVEYTDSEEGDYEEDYEDEFGLDGAHMAADYTDGDCDAEEFVDANDELRSGFTGSRAWQEGCGELRERGPAVNVSK